MTPISVPCVICCAESYQGESNWMVVCCRAVFCAICIGYYLEDAEYGSVCHCCNGRADAAFQSEAHVDRKREEDEEEKLREIALQSLCSEMKRKVPEDVKPKAPLMSEANAEAEEAKKMITWDSAEPNVSEMAQRRSQKRRIQSDFNERKPKRNYPNPSNGWKTAFKQDSGHRRTFPEFNRNQVDDSARIMWARCTAAL